MSSFGGLQQVCRQCQWAVDWAGDALRFTGASYESLAHSLASFVRGTSKSAQDLGSFGGLRGHCAHLREGGACTVGWHSKEGNLRRSGFLMQ